MSGLAISLATRGHVCCTRGPTVVTSLAPSINASTIEPTVTTEGTKSPEFDVVVPDLEPELVAKGTEAPDFEVGPISEPVPSADTKKVSDTPEVQIRPVVDLRPTIVNKDDD